MQLSRRRRLQPRRNNGFTVQASSQLAIIGPNVGVREHSFAAPLTPSEKKLGISKRRGCHVGRKVERTAEEIQLP